jgi:hypothetical protein
MLLFAIILLILFGLVILTGVILSLIVGIRPVQRFDLRRLFPTLPPNDFFSLIRILTYADPLWHTGRGDIPDPVAEAPAPEFPTHPMESLMTSVLALNPRHRNTNVCLDGHVARLIKSPPLGKGGFCVTPPWGEPAFATLRGLNPAVHKPPSSSGPGRGPLKAQTAVRVRLGALLYTGVRKAVTIEWIG